MTACAFSYFQSIIGTDFGRDNFGAGIEAFGRPVIDDPSAFPPEFWQLYLQSNFTALGEEYRPVCVGMTWRRFLAAGTMRQWRRFGVGARGGVEKVALCAQMHHEAKNWLILTDFSNAFNTVKRTAVLTEVATCVPALTPFVAKYYDERSAPMFFLMNSGESRKIDCSSGAQQGDATEPALPFLSLLPVLKRTRQEFEPKGVEAFAYLNDISIGMVEAASDTVDVVQRELASIGFTMNLSETVASPSKSTYRHWKKCPSLKALTPATRNTVG